MNSIDIIIVNYKSTRFLMKCLVSVCDNLGDLSAKIYVEDNASDGSINEVVRNFPEVKVARHRENLGFSGAVNRALKRSHGSFVFLLNPDTVTTKGFFESTIYHMQENPEVGIVGPKILDQDGSVQGSARTFPGPLTGLFGRSSLLSKFFPNNPFTRANILTTRSDGRRPMEVDWVSGACLVVRRKAVEDVGLMDERFFLYWEDADWCRRMWNRGWKVVYFPRASVVHYIGGSSEKALVRSVLEFHKSSYRLFKKHTKSSLWFVRPLAIAGISVRVFFVLAFNAGRLWCQRHNFAVRHKKRIVFPKREGG
ncbi:MAG: glycosyltransferase family 2 protein [Candidatus Hodarchaeota archaeon]